MGIYIHIPFCVRKCAYCDFLSAPADEDTRKRYIQALLEEIALKGKQAAEYEARSVFLGGGTPSILDGAQIGAVLDAVAGAFSVNAQAEITVECNPGTLSARKLSEMSAAGVNRLSIGLQSADNEQLRVLGRIHTWEQFLENYRAARQAGFENINIDLMSAIPGQSARSWKNTLLLAAEMRPEHISAYSLIVEEGTPFYERYHEDVLLQEQGKMPRFLPSEDLEREMYEQTREVLSGYGYHRYEISNYALDGRESVHNTGYWQRIEYLGLGLGASSQMGKERYKNTEDLGHYLEKDFSAKEIQTLDRKQEMEETMFLGLRMMEGVSMQEFERRFGVSMQEIYGSRIRDLTDKGLLCVNNDRLCLTAHGIDVSNYVFAGFLLDG